MNTSTGNDHEVDYGPQRCYIRDLKSLDTIKLRRKKGVVQLPAWVVTYEIAITGKITVRAQNGDHTIVHVDPSVFSRLGA